MNTPPLDLIVVTPTRDRPEAFAIARRWMGRQTLATKDPPVFEWFIADDGDQPCVGLNQVAGLGQQLLEPGAPPGPPRVIRATYYRHAPRKAVCTLHDNLEDFVTWLLEERKDFNGWLAIWEDDEYYSADYLETMLLAAKANGPGLVGIADAHYWHVQSRGWHHGGSHVHSSLCRTFLHRHYLGLLRQAIQESRAERSVFIDLKLWAAAKAAKVPTTLLEGAWRLSIGIKGLPGRGGLGKGHNPTAYKNRDEDGKMLRAWIGDDADVYLDFRNKGATRCQ